MTRRLTREERRKKTEERRSAISYRGDERFQLGSENIAKRHEQMFILYSGYPHERFRFSRGVDRGVENCVELHITF